MTQRPFSRRAYRLLLHLAPGHLRRSHGDDMEQFFIEMLDLETARRGVAGWILVWAGAVKDAVGQSISERLGRPGPGPIQSAREHRGSGPALVAELRRSLRLEA